MQEETNYNDKLIEIDELLEIIKPGNKIFLSSGNAIPAHTINGMIKSNKKNLLDLELVQLLTLGEYLSKDIFDNVKFRLKTFNIGESISKGLKEGNVDFIPANLIEIPYILSSGALDIDIAIVLTSPPDEKGFLNLGVAVDVADIAIKNASIVIAEINPNMPVTHGSTSIHLDQVDYIIKGDLPLLERHKKEYDQVIDKIAWHISNLIEDGSTVVLHVGRIYDAIASHLKNKKNLGILTNVISDWVIELIESGAISHERSRNKGGKVTTSYCYGSKKLYDYVDKNPIFAFQPLARLANPYTLVKLGGKTDLISIMNVKKIDISGESVIFHSGDNLLSGYESKLNFAIGAAFSKDGKAIVALRSIDQAGNSNIVISHEKDNERIKATLGATRYVVTEYGVANLFGKSIRERVLAMIDIAHPNHREKLLNLAKDYGYAYPDQIYIMKDAANYPIELETTKRFKNGLEINFRPIKPSDEDMMRKLFYNFSDESKYLRYFANIAAMPHKDMQKYVNIDYNETLSIIGIYKKNRTEKIIAEARISINKSKKSFEMGFVVDENFQGNGIATFLMNYFFLIGINRNIKALTASVIAQNKKMLKVFQKSEIEPEKKVEDSIIKLKFKLKK